MQTVKRLYDQFHPEHYSVTFDLTDKDHNHTFYATTMITGEKLSEKPLRLHAVDLSVNSITINGEVVSSYSQEGDELVIQTNQTGRIVVFIEVQGIATDAMHGIYPCYYEMNGEKRELFATQFESHHAREAFPCVDEPEAKATFDVTLITKPGVTALSNMPVLRSQVLDFSSFETVFERSPRMSSYLLAFVVGDLQRRSTKTWRGTEINVYATPVHPEKNLAYACTWAKQSIEFFEDYFDTHYPLPKCDQVALPDFSVSAMENWGLITYREAALLVDPKHATSETKQRVSTVISHEISHQWFGNLVTMKWWDDLWLNESFANLMEYIACDALQPDWNIWDEFSANECLIALRRDAFDGVQPVKLAVQNPGEIESLFDHAIVYAKGSRLIRMIHEYIGDDAFRYGLREYFRQFAYQNTTESDLWNSLSAASGKDIAAFIGNWLTKPGYPLVTFNNGRLSQERFFIGSHSDDDTIWPIPLLSNAINFPKILSTRELEVENNLTILNMSDGSHFVTNYDDTQFAHVVHAISHDKLTPTDTLRILNEQLLLSVAGKVGADRLINVLKAIQNNTSPSVWKAALNIFSQLKFVVEEDPIEAPLLRQFAHELATNQHVRLSWKQTPKESENNTRLRPLILEVMGYSASSDIVKFAKAAFSAGFEDMTPSTRTPVSRIVMYNGIEDPEFAELIELYRTTHSPELQLDLIAALCATRAPEQIQTLLNCLTDGTIRLQDIRRWIPQLLAQSASREKTWEWISSHWDWIVKNFKGDVTFDSIPTYAGRYLTKPEHLAQYKELFEPWKFEAAIIRAIEIGEKEISANIAYIANNKELLTEALKGVKEINT